MAKRKKQSDVKRARQEARPVELPRADEQLSVAIVGGGASGYRGGVCRCGLCARGAGGRARRSSRKRQAHGVVYLAERQWTLQFLA